MGKGVSACATCDGFFYKGQDVVVVGGGNTAVEEALYLSNIAKHVTVVHRRDKFRAEAILVDRLMAKTRNGGNMSVVWNHTLDDVLGDASGVTGAVLRTMKSDATQNLSVHGVFIAIGHTPNTQIFEGQLDMAGGYIKVKGGSEGNATATSAAGRVRRGRRRRPRVPAGGHVGRHGMHGGIRCRGVSGRPLTLSDRRDGEAVRPQGAATRRPSESAPAPRLTAAPAPAPSSDGEARARRRQARRRRHRPLARRSPTCRSCRRPTGRPSRAPSPRPVPHHTLADERDVLDDVQVRRQPAPQTWDTGQEFEHEQTFVRAGLGPDIAGKLRRGHWSVQAELDLHGLNTDEAHDALSDFIVESRTRRFRCVRVIHGKGLTSPNREPVLKGKVRSWLAHWDEVLAYAEAPQHAGGGGAVLVLLKGS